MIEVCDPSCSEYSYLRGCHPTRLLKETRSLARCWEVQWGAFASLVPRRCMRGTVCLHLQRSTLRPARGCLTVWRCRRAGWKTGAGLVLVRKEQTRAASWNGGCRSREVDNLACGCLTDLSRKIDFRVTGMSARRSAAEHCCRSERLRLRVMGRTALEPCYLERLRVTIET